MKGKTLPGKAEIVEVGHLRLKPDAVPPSDKFEALMTVGNKFKQTWERKRTDGAFASKQDASTYDFSLINLAVDAGWSDQEVANLVIAWRRKHGLDVSKGLRQDYMEMSIGKVRADKDQIEAESELRAMPNVSLPKGMKKEDLSEEEQDEYEMKRQKVLSTISRRLGVRIAALIQTGRENAKYTLVLENGEEIRLGSSSDLFNFDKCRHAIVDQTGVALKRMKRAAWEEVAMKLVEVRTQVEADTSIDHETQDWLQRYFSKISLVILESHRDIITHRPVHSIDQPCIYPHPESKLPTIGLRLEDLQQTLSIAGVKNLSRSELSDRLRRAGFTQETRGVNQNQGGATTRSLWEIEATVARQCGFLVGVSMPGEEGKTLEHWNEQRKNARRQISNDSDMMPESV